MAVTVTAYTEGKIQILGGEIDLEKDLIKVSLHTCNYRPDIHLHQDYGDLTNEVPDSGGYVVGGKELKGKTVYPEDEQEVFDASDTNWSEMNVSVAIRYGVIYKSTDGISTLIAFIDFGEDQIVVQGQDFTIQWHKDGILYI